MGIKRNNENVQRKDKAKNSVKVSDSLEELLGINKGNNTKLRDIIKVPIHSDEKEKLFESIDLDDVRNNGNYEINSIINDEINSGIVNKNKHEINNEMDPNNFSLLDKKWDKDLDKNQNQNQNQNLPDKDWTSISDSDRFISIDSASSITTPDGYIQCPPGIDIIPFTKKAWQDLILLAQAINEISTERWGADSEKLEVYCYVLADPSDIDPDKPAKISEIYIPYHTAAEANVNVSEEGVLDVMNFLRSTNKVLLGWAHSHGHYDVYSSSTDEINHQVLLHETSNYISLGNFKIKYAYGITINADGDHFGVVLSQYPCGHIQRVDNVVFEIDDSGGYTPNEFKERMEYMKRTINSRVDIIKPREKQSKEEALNSLVEELTEKFLFKLKNVKNILFDRISEDSSRSLGNLQEILKVLSEYDHYVLEAAHETFAETSKKLFSHIHEYKDDI